MKFTPSLLERDAARAQLQAALVAARAGAGRTVLVRGEAGIGKTSLLRAWSAEAVDHEGAQVFTGSCESLFTPRPLGPVMDIATSIGSLVRDAAEEQRSPSVIFAAIASWLATPAVSLRSRANQPRVTVLVFEDVHWADHLTLDFIKYLARRIHAWPALLVLSYRDDEVGPMHPLTQVLGELPAAGTVAVDLEALSLDAVKSLSGYAVREAAELLRVTAGNPFFVTEVVAAQPGAIVAAAPTSHAAGAGVPVTVASAVLARAQRVSPAARAVLEVASLSPGSIEPALIAALAGPQAHDGIDECVAAGLLRWHEHGFAFRHELARLAIESALTPMRRRAMHARVYEQLRHESQTVLDRMAYHARHAHDRSAVLTTAPQAAERAARLGAHREAASHYSVALDHADGADDAVRADLLERWAYEMTMTGGIDDTLVQARLDALALRRALDDVEKIGMNQRWLSRLYRLLGRRVESEQLLDEAIATLESVPPGPELAMAYSMRSAGFMLVNQCASAEAWGLRAIDLARAHHAAEIEAHALNNVGSALVDDGQERGFDMLERSLAISLEHGFHEHAARAYVNASEAAVRTRALARAEKMIVEGLDFVQRNDMDMYAPSLAGSLAQLRLMQGRLDEALAVAERELAERGRANVTRLPLRAATATVAMLRNPAADHEALSALWPEVLEFGEPDSVVPVALALAEAAWLREDAAAGAAVVLKALAVCKNLSAWDRGELMCWYERAGHDAQGLTGGPIAPPTQVELAGDLEEAAARWEALQMPRNHAYALMAMTDRPDALSAAIAMFDRINCVASAQYGRRLARRLATAGLKGIKTGPRAAARANRFGLTPKERQIAAHLAQGHSNHQIATAVSRSERTVEHHVSTVLAKLGAKRRGDVAQILGEAGELETLLGQTLK